MVTHIPSTVLLSLSLSCYNIGQYISPRCLYTACLLLALQCLSRVSLKVFALLMRVQPSDYPPHFVKPKSGIYLFLFVFFPISSIWLNILFFTIILSSHIWIFSLIIQVPRTKTKKKESLFEVGF